MARSKKRERRAEIQRMAEELARSGEFSQWVMVEVHLRTQHDVSYDESKDAFDDPWQKSRIDRLCREARERSERDESPTHS